MGYFSTRIFWKEPDADDQVLEDDLIRKDAELDRANVACVRAFVGEQPLFFLEAARIPGERCVGADHAMAGHHDRDRVERVCVADSTRVRVAELRGDLAVRARFAIWNRAERGPDARLIRRAAAVDG